MKIIRKLSDMRLRAAVFSAAFALVSTSAAAEDIAPPKAKTIASTSLCGDSYMLELAPERLVALSWQSRDALSLAEDPQKSLPQIWDNPESYISSGADLIIFGPYEGVGSERFLPKAGIKSHQLLWADDFETIYTNLENLGTVTGRRKKARRMASDIKTRLADLDALPNKPKVLYLARAGFSAGPGTYVDAAIKAAGGENIIDKPGWPKLDPEYLISLKPDLIITSFFNDGYESINAAPVRHYSVARFIERHERLDIPGSVWPCGGPDLIDAAEMIHDRLRVLP